MSDLTGQCLGQYEILARISKGSTSTVYKAYQSKLDRFVAVKVLSPQVVDEEGFLERFTQEARAVAQLDHPNIVPVYDFDREGDVAYIVMKYVESGTLRSMMTGAPMDLGLTVDIVTQVGLALGYAHRRGVIHRDVKPSNVLIGQGRWALLTDFGLAKMLSSGGHITRSGVGMGTPDYMSPEQAQGLAGDGRVDLYSLGATLYEMVTGRPPFKADSLMGVVVKHITEPPPPPRQFNPDLPEALESVILKALAKDPASRFQTAEAMVAAIVRGAGPATERTTVPGADLAALSVTRPAEPSLSDTSATSSTQRTRLAEGIIRAWEKVKQTGNQLKSRVIRADGFSKRQRVTWGGVALAGLVLLALLGGLILGRPGEGALAPPQATATALPPAMVVTPATPIPAPSPTPVRPSGAPPPTPPTAEPSPTPEWEYLSSTAPIRPGIYVKVVRPAGLDVRNAPGFETEFIVTLAAGKILYVLDGPTRADSLSWIKISDGVTTGWGVQDQVAPFGIRNR